jgi:hypothetical protein
MARAFRSRRVTTPATAVDVQKVLMTDARHLSAAAVVALYAVRWQIERFVKELKSGLGFAQYRLLDFAAVDAWVPLALLAFLYLEDYRRRQLARRDLDERERQRWPCPRTHGLCQAVRQQAEGADLQEVAKRLKTPGGLRRLKQLLRAAVPAPYRIAA